MRIGSTFGRFLAMTCYIAATMRKHKVERKCFKTNAARSTPRHRTASDIFRRAALVTDAISRLPQKSTSNSSKNRNEFCGIHPQKRERGVHRVAHGEAGWWLKGRGNNHSAGVG
jgi:hypothetical protein